MPTTAGTSPDDVRVEIETGLKDGAISNILTRVDREIDRAYSTPDFQNSQHRQDFEAALAALRIAEGRDRRASEASTGGVRTDYEAAEIDQLRKRVRRDDPGDEFGHAGTISRDSGRNISTT